MSFTQKCGNCDKGSEDESGVVIETECSKDGQLHATNHKCDSWARTINLKRLFESVEK